VRPRASSRAAHGGEREGEIEALRKLNTGR